MNQTDSIICIQKYKIFSGHAFHISAALQAPLSMGFSRQEYWTGLPCPPPGDLPNTGIKPRSLTSPALAGRFFTTSATGEAHGSVYMSIPISQFIPLPLSLSGNHCCCSVAKLCLTLYDPMDCSTLAFLVLHYLPEFAPIHVH